MGPNGSGKSTLANTLLAHPDYEVTSGSIALQGRRHHRLGHRRAGQGRPVPGLPVPGGDPRGVGGAVPAPGPVGPQGHRPVGARAAAVDHGVDGPPGHRPVLRRPLPQRGLLRRREEAQRGPADGDPRARVRGARRDRLRPRHRRPEGGVQRGVRGPQGPARARRAAHHPLPAHPAVPRARRGAHPGRRPHRGPGRRRPGPPAGARGLRRVARLASPDPRAPTLRSKDRLPARSMPGTGARRDRWSTSTRRPAPRSPGPCSTPWTATTRPPTPTSTGACTGWPRRPPPPSRTPGPRSPASSAPRRPPGVVFTKNATEAINLVAHSYGRHLPAAGPGDPAHRDGAPRQPRPLADAGRGEGRRAALPAGGRRRHAASSTTSTACSTASGW